MEITIKNFEDYIPLALRTESAQNNSTDMVALIKVITLYIQLGEILDGFKKQIFYGKSEKLVKELSEINKVQNVLTGLSKYMEENGLQFTETLNEKNVRDSHGLLGIMTESAELAQVLMNIVNNEKVDAVNIQEELCDIAWYQAILEDALKLDHYQGLINNINKLKVRYPDKFTTESATNRNLENERLELENGFYGTELT